MDNASKYGIWLLSKRDYTKKKITEKMKQKNYTDDEAKSAVEYLESCGYLNDENYARRFAKYLLEIKKFGKPRIKSELFAKGIDREITELVLTEFEIDENEHLLPLIEKKLKGNFEYDNQNKVKRYFYSRGYSTYSIDECIKKLQEEYEN